MHNNYHFLKQLTAEISGKWTGARIDGIYTQEKNELILQACQDNGQELYLKAHLRPTFCCLSFPSTHHRARKNSMNLFRDIEGMRITRIYQYENERAFSFQLEGNRLLVFKMFGNRSNILQFTNNQVTGIFRNELKNDLGLSSDLDRPIDQSFEAFSEAAGNFRQLYPTFGKDVGAYLNTQGYREKSLQEQWELIQHVLQHLENPPYYICENKSYEFSLLPCPGGSQFSDPVLALNYFFQNYFMRGLLLREKKEILQVLSREIVRSEKYLERIYRKLTDLETRTSYRSQADLLMANLHAVAKGSKSVTLENFYDENRPVTIRLNPRLTPQDNAGVLYQKAKSQHREVSQLEQNIAEREIVLEQARNHVQQITKIEDVKELRKYIQDNDLGQTISESGQATLPYREYSFQGFMIRVGRNAKANDKMLQQYSFKEDLWMHAKDSAGSHVLVKHQAGKSFPAPVIEKAARLAAYYSRRKNDTLCPVIATPRKFVRKRKGDPPGAVVVDREENVLLVPPEDFGE